MPTAHVNGIDLNYKLEGDGGAGTIVLVNGLADDLETWVLQMEDFLGAGYRVLRIDNRGVGKSSAPPGPYTSEGCATIPLGTTSRSALSAARLLR